MGTTYSPKKKSPPKKKQKKTPGKPPVAWSDFGVTDEIETKGGKTMPESVRVYEFRTPELTRGGAIVRAEEDNAGNVIFGYALCSMSDVFDPHGAMCKQVLRERLRNEHEDPSNEDLVENLWTPLQIRRAFDNEERYFEFELMRVRSFIRLMWMHYCRKHDHKPPRLRLNLKRGWGQALHSRYMHWEES